MSATTNPDLEPLIEESVEVSATPEQVWALVSDLAAMPRWSPQVAKVIVRGDGGVGTRTININREGLKVWPTRSKVVRADPHREFAFRIKDNKAIWSFTLEPTDAGTRIVQRREVPDGISPASQRLTDLFMGGTKGLQANLRRGMQQTLQRIKADLEG